MTDVLRLLLEFARARIRTKFGVATLAIMVALTAWCFATGRIVTGFIALALFGGTWVPVLPLAGAVLFMRWRERRGRRFPAK